MRNLLILISLLLMPAIQAQHVRDFQFKDINNQARSYQELKGEQLTLLDFWATWCKPCIRAIPELTKIHEDYSENGVAIIGVNCDGPRSVSKVGPYSRAKKIPYPVLIDIDTELMNELNLSAYPTLVLVNQADEIVWIHEGFVPGDEAEIRAEIEKQLAGM